MFIFSTRYGIFFSSSCIHIFWQYGHHAALSRYSSTRGSPVVPNLRTRACVDVGPFSRSGGALDCPCCARNAVTRDASASHVGAESVNTTPWRDARPAGAEAPADNGDIAALARARSCSNMPDAKEPPEAAAWTTRRGACDGANALCRCAMVTTRATRGQGARDDDATTRWYPDPTAGSERVRDARGAWSDGEDEGAVTE
mmetsp:Transcript_24904/g.39982  ORF Transcript_24904/g.39982 Transcript_24904/m.39982 type:complete len:200 (-) Transcript_24904:66-665(-)